MSSGQNQPNFCISDWFWPLVSNLAKLSFMWIILEFSIEPQLWKFQEYEIFSSPSISYFFLNFSNDIKENCFSEVGAHLQHTTRTFSPNSWMLWSQTTLLSLFPPVLCQPANHADFIGTKNYEGRAIPQNGEFPPETLFLQWDIWLITPFFRYCFVHTLS